MLCEYRSGDRGALEIMKGKFEEIFALARREDVDVCVKVIGERPCSDIDKDKQTEFVNKIIALLNTEGIDEIKRTFGSTDSNIPLSLGIPAVTLGVYKGGKAHTRAEWIEKASLTKGLTRAISLASLLL